MGSAGMPSCGAGAPGVFLIEAGKTWVGWGLKGEKKREFSQKEGGKRRDVSWVFLPMSSALTTEVRAMRQAMLPCFC
jgi:hypothetical protein